MDVDSNRAFCDSGIVEDRSLDYSSGPDSTSPTSLCFTPVKWSREMYATRIPIATWRLAELEFFSTKIPIAKWRLREFYKHLHTVESKGYLLGCLDVQNGKGV
ncbi:hypothetical protein J6590_065474 [Homalodisca vitripennis]|nr:hypothetical protein J6590_065474 [Homalodisca vitripennis]